VTLTLQLAGQWRERKLLRQDAVARIVSPGMGFGSKVIKIDPGTAREDPLVDHALIKSEPSADIMQAVGQVGKLIDTVKHQEARVGELLDNTNRMVRQGYDTLESIQQLSDAAKGAPIVRNYVKDPQGLLVRPECERNMWIFPEASLFEPDSARLTTDGQKKLDEVAKKVNELKHDGSDVVVVAYADPRANAAGALTLTQKQSEVVMNYLKDQHQVHKMGWISSRSIKALGMGVKPAPPEPGRESGMPPARVEVLVFVPRKA
jgi:outer membrane protein OmpA-like peptidoglycan-associated protein